MGSNRSMLWHQYTTQHNVSAMLNDASEDTGTGFPTRYRFDGKIFEA